MSTPQEYQRLAGQRMDYERRIKFLRAGVEEAIERLERIPMSRMPGAAVTAEQALRRVIEQDDAQA
jgi:hypothetical protein